MQPVNWVFVDRKLLPRDFIQAPSAAIFPLRLIPHALSGNIPALDACWQPTTGMFIDRSKAQRIQQRAKY